MTIEQLMQIAIQHHRDGRLDAAIAAYRRVVALNPEYAEGHSNLGVVLSDKGQLDEAITAYRRALALRDDLPETHVNLGNALMARRQLDEAIVAYRRAIALRPDFAEAHRSLGVAFKDKRQPDDAIAAYRQAIALRPGYAEAHVNLGNALKDKGELDEAIAAYRRAVALKPEYVVAHSNLLYTLHFHRAYDPRAIADEHRCWQQQHAEALEAFIRPHGNDRDPGRRLRIGYVSPYFRGHPVGRLLLPLLAHHDHQRFEVFAYAQVPVPDPVTQRLRSVADRWQSTVGLSDSQVANLIRQDQIDILVDLTLHMAHSRLLVFARKPAPVQVTWLGYPSTTGLRAMDFRLSDPYMDPAGLNDPFYVEQTIRLADTFQLYDPAPEEVPVNPLPALEQGFVTFGCLNNFCKVNDPQLLLWARILQQSKNSRLMLLTWPGSHRQRTREFMAVDGIAPERLIFPDKPPTQSGYLRLYHGIDLGLDPYPYNGHTTSMDSLWMGVPVVSLYGPTAVSRAGLSQCSNLGLQQLATDRPDEYVRIAVELAGDLPRLMELRRNLRQMMRQSPLMDAPRFARNIEAAYRQMWRTWCEACR